MAQDPNSLFRMDIVGDHIETWVREESEWTDRHTNALFQRIIEDNESRDEMLTRINNRQASLS